MNFFLPVDILFDMKMKAVYYFLVIFGICNFSIFGDNIFLEKLSNLLDYCLESQENFDYGALLGISLAKQQLLSETTSKIAKNLVESCEDLENSFSLQNIAESNEIGSTNIK